MLTHEPRHLPPCLIFDVRRKMTPMSPFEEAMWDYLPPAIWWLSLFGGIVACACFFLSWRLSKNKGHLLLAVAVAIPILLSGIGGLRRIQQRYTAGADGIPVIHTSIRLDLFCISMLVAAGALSIYRKEKKKEPNQPSQRNASTGSVANFESPARRG